MSSAEVIVVGSYNSDIILSVGHLPKPGETYLILGRSASPGGKGSNQAVQASRCGAQVAMIAALGNDSAADEALDVWLANGIDARAVPRLTAYSTGMAVILVDAQGENCIVVDPGADAHLGPQHIEAAAPSIAAGKLVLAQLETPVATTLRAFEIAHAHGVATALNAAPAPEQIDAALLARTDILFVNQGEAMALSG